MPKSPDNAPKGSALTTATDKLLTPYVALGLLLYISFRCNFVSVAVIGKAVMIYAVSIVYIFYFYHYKMLANTKVYMLWLAVAIIQLFVYYNYNSRDNLMGIYGSVFTPLRSLFLFLILYQIVRQASLHFYHKEPVMMCRNELELTSLEYATTLPIFFVSLISCFNM